MSSLRWREVGWCGNYWAGQAWSMQQRYDGQTANRGKFEERQQELYGKRWSIADKIVAEKLKSIGGVSDGMNMRYC